MKFVLIQKSILHSALLLFAIFLSYESPAQSVQLPREWKFQLGDNPDWANLSFNDSDWGKKKLATSFAAKELKDNVFAWYRIKLIISSDMKSAVEKGKGIKLKLGKIDDVDQTFFNGKLIGQTGSLPPHYETKWDAERIYTIPANEVQWDKENVISVRVFSLDNSGIGMYQGDYNYRPVQWTDSISVQHVITETANHGFSAKISFTNSGQNAFYGAAKYWVSDIAGKILFTETKPFELKASKGSVNSVSFTGFQPDKNDIFKVGYLISVNNSTATLKNEEIYLANKQVEIKVAKEPNPVVENKIQDVFNSIPFQDQQLQGYLGTRLKQNLEERVLKVDEDGIMDGYLQRPGNHPWIGEHVGKYLETACNVWKNTHDQRLKKQMDRMMYELIHTQLADGYLGTYSPDEYWTSWDVWSHKYNLYGLLAYYTATGYQPALDACKKMGNLLCKTFGNNPGQRDIILAGEHVGMAATSVLDPLVELYRYTGEKKYLDFCYYILDAWEHPNGPKIISSLLKTGKVSQVANAKAYEMLSNLVGLTKLYRLTGDTKLLKPVLIAWQDIVTNRLYVTGSASSMEHFQEDEFLPAANNDNIGEGCVTTTWIQLNQNLLAVTGELKYADQIEKTIYNHLLGAENPETGCVSYYTSLMDKKPFSCGISCCTSSVPRGIAMIPYFAFGNIKNVPTVMLYEPASYHEEITTSTKEDIDLSLEIAGNFPENGNAVITVKSSKTATFPIALRVPSWSVSYVADVEGYQFKGTPNQYLSINREWKAGDQIKVSFEMPVQILSGGKSYPGQLAFQRGPQVLAFDDSLNPGIKIEANQKLSVEKPESKSFEGVLPRQWIGKQVFSLNESDKTKQLLILVPFADASQTGGAVKVWLPLRISN